MGRFSKEAPRIISGAAVLAEIVRSALVPSPADAAANKEYFEDQLIPPVRNNLVVPMDQYRPPIFENDSEQLLRRTETEQQTSSRLYLIPQVEIDNTTWEELQTLIPDGQRESLLAQDSIAFSFSFEVDGPETRPDARSLFPHNPELAARVQALIDLVYQQNGTPGVYEISVLVDHQTDDGSIQGSPTLRTTIPEATLGAETFTAGTQLSIGEDGSYHWLEPGTFEIDGKSVDVKRVIVCPVSAIAEFLESYGLDVPEDEDATLMVGVNASGKIVVVITETQAIALESMAMMQITSTTNVRAYPNASAEQIGQKQAGDVVILATEADVLRIMGDAVPDRLIRDPEKNTVYVNDGRYDWYPEVSVNDQGEETINWFARLNEAGVFAIPTPDAPNSGLVLASYSQNTGLEAVAPPAIPETSELNALNTDWLEVARNNPEVLANIQLSPELEAALQDPNYLQIGYLNEEGEFVGIPIVFNPAGDEEKRELIATDKDIHAYYVVQTPRTRDVVLNAIIPAIQDLFENYNSIPDALPITPQIIVTHGEMEDRSGFLPVNNSNSFQVYRKYDPETNVLHINVITSNDYGMWGADVVGILASAVTLGFSADENVQADSGWWNWVNQNTTNNNSGLMIMTSDNQLRRAPDYPLEFPVDLSLYDLE